MSNYFWTWTSKFCSTFSFLLKQSSELIIIFNGFRYFILYKKILLSLLNICKLHPRYDTMLLQWRIQWQKADMNPLPRVEICLGDTAEKGRKDYIILLFYQISGSATAFLFTLERWQTCFFLLAMLALFKTVRTVSICVARLLCHQIYQMFHRCSFFYSFSVSMTTCYPQCIVDGSCCGVLDGKREVSGR